MTGKRDGGGDRKSICRPVVVIWEGLGQAVTEITETKQRVVVEFHREVVTGERKLQKLKKIGGKKLLVEEEHAGLDSDWD